MARDYVPAFNWTPRAIWLEAVRMIRDVRNKPDVVRADPLRALGTLEERFRREADAAQNESDEMAANLRCTACGAEHFVVRG